MALEAKQGTTQLELLCEELEQKERRKEEKKELKKLKKQRQKKAKMQNNCTLSNQTKNISNSLEDIDDIPCKVRILNTK